MLLVANIHYSSTHLLSTKHYKSHTERQKHKNRWQHLKVAGTLVSEQERTTHKIKAENEVRSHIAQERNARIYTGLNINYATKPYKEPTIYKHIIRGFRAIRIQG